MANFMYELSPNTINFDYNTKCSIVNELYQPYDWSSVPETSTTIPGYDFSSIPITKYTGRIIRHTDYFTEHYLKLIKTILNN